MTVLEQLRLQFDYIHKELFRCETYTESAALAQASVALASLIRRIEEDEADYETETAIDLEALNVVVDELQERLEAIGG